MTERTWVIGMCWRYETDDLPVLWLGPVQSEYEGHAPFFACESCTQRLKGLIRAYNSSRSGTP